jgi:hypothetical protein
MTSKTTRTQEEQQDRRLFFQRRISDEMVRCMNCRARLDIGLIFESSDDTLYVRCWWCKREWSEKDVDLYIEEREGIYASEWTQEDLDEAESDLKHANKELKSAQKEVLEAERRVAELKLKLAKIEEQKKVSGGEF